MQRWVGKPGRTSDDVGAYENQRSLFAFLATVYLCITSVCELKRLYRSIVMPCQHFVITKPPREERREKKEHRLISFGLAPNPLPSSYVTMGFPVEISSRK